VEHDHCQYRQMRSHRQSDYPMASEPCTRWLKTGEHDNT
jgi:hypothetical protein